jgi:hypothetical protein
LFVFVSTGTNPIKPNNADRRLRLRPVQNVTLFSVASISGPTNYVKKWSQIQAWPYGYVSLLNQ